MCCLCQSASHLFLLFSVWLFHRGLCVAERAVSAEAHLSITPVCPAKCDRRVHSSLQNNRNRGCEWKGRAHAHGVDIHQKHRVSSVDHLRPFDGRMSFQPVTACIQTHIFRQSCGLSKHQCNVYFFIIDSGRNSSSLDIIFCCLILVGLTESRKWSSTIIGSGQCCGTAKVPNAAFCEHVSECKKRSSSQNGYQQYVYFKRIAGHYLKWLDPHHFYVQIPRLHSGKSWLWRQCSDWDKSRCRNMYVLSHFIIFTLSMGTVCCLRVFWHSNSLSSLSVLALTLWEVSLMLHHVSRTQTLHYYVRLSSKISSFRSSLETHLFKLSYWLHGWVFSVLLLLAESCFSVHGLVLLLVFFSVRELVCCDFDVIFFAFM